MKINFFLNMNSRKTLRWWIISYSVIIVLSILINLRGFYVSVGVVERELEKTNTLMTSHVANVSDNYLFNIKSLAYTIVQSNSVKAVSEYNEMSRTDQVECLKNLMQDISVSIIGNPMINNSIVVFEDYNLCVDRDSMASTEKMYSMHFKELYHSEKAWLEDVFDESLSEFKVKVDHKNDHKMFFVHKRLSLEQAPSVAVIMEISNDAIGQFETNMLNGNDGKMVVADADGNCIFASGDMETLGFSLTEERGSFRKFMNGQERMVSYVKSAYADIYYVYLISYDTFVKNIRYIKAEFIAGYCLCIIIGGILIYLFSKINYSIKKKTDEKLSEQSESLKEHFLMQALQKQIEIGSYTQSFLDNNLILNGRSFAVVIFDVVQPEEETNHGAEAYIKEKFQLLLKDVANVYYCEIYDMLVAVLNVNSDGVDTACIVRMAQNLRLMVNTETGVDFVCAISHFAGEASELAALYTEAMEDINRVFLETDKAIFTSGAHESESGGYDYDIDTEKKLMNNLVSGNEAEAVALMDRVFDYNINVMKISFSLFKVLLVEITGTLLKAALQENKTAEFDLNALYIGALNCTNTAGLHEIKEQIYRVIVDFCRSVRENEKSRSAKNYAPIRAYIDAHYTNPDLNVNMIAEVFGYTPSHMSRLFKEQFGEGLADYIVKLRMKKAKELLVDTDRTVAAVGESVGFGSSTVFVRAFKRYEGITPKQYREISV